MKENCYLISPEELSERRAGNRLKAVEGAAAVLYNDGYRVGPIVDVSRTGLSFRYIDDGEKIDDATQLAIVVTGQGFYLRMIPIRTVYDIVEETNVAFSSITMRRRGVRFGRLTNMQTTLLSYFLKNYTVDTL